MTREEGPPGAGAERPTILSVALGRIRVDHAWRYRDPLEVWEGAARLRASIRRVGLLCPMRVTASNLQLVGGFRRMAVLQELGRPDDFEVPVRVVEGAPTEVFAETVELHAGEVANLREVAWALRIGQTLGLTPDQAAGRLLPPLGLEPHPALARRYLQLLELPEELLRFFVDKGFSLRRCQPFCRLAKEEAAVVATLVGFLKGGRQLEETVAQLAEVAARDGVALPELAEELGLISESRHEQALARLSARRMPETTARRQELESLCGELSEHGVRVHWDRNFTSERLTLMLEIASLQQLDERLRDLARAEARHQLRRILERALG